MVDLPKLSKGIASGLTKLESVRKAVLGVALAVGLAASTAGAAVPQPQPSADIPAIYQDNGAMLLAPTPSSPAPGTVAQHWSHSSHYSHSSHSSHYSSRW